MSAPPAILIPGAGLSSVAAHPFLLHAFLAGVPISALSGSVGYLMVLRSQIFTGDALSHVAFTGALALAVGFGRAGRTVRRPC